MKSGLVFPQVAMFNPSEKDELGLTKRELFAAMAMQGVLVDGENLDPEPVAYMAVRYADALIAALSQKE